MNLRPYLIALLFLFALTPSNLYAENSAAVLDSTEGEVEFSKGGTGDFTTAAKGAPLNDGDVVRTGRYGRASLIFSDGFLLRLAENTTLQIRPRGGTGERNLQLDNGQGYFFSREPQNFPVVSSPAVTTAVRGTEFVVRASATETTVSVLDGKVECKNDFGSVQMGPGEQALTKKGQAPVKSILVKPSDAVQWALSYPPLLDKSELENALKQSAGGKDLDQSLSLMRALNAARGGDDVDKALGRYESYKGKNFPALRLSAAELYLSRGQVDKARAELAAAKKGIAAAGAEKRSLSAAASALDSIIFLVLDDKNAAQAAAKSAIAENADSAPALLANAYVSQAGFDLDSAKDWLGRLSGARPDSAFALAKLAELELGYGHVDEAGELLQRAMALDPGHPYVLSVNGFYHLVRDETEEGSASFERALAAAPNMAVAHLGKGLALIRNGELPAGRDEIKRAAFLDPMVSLYRSYLGKAYFEEEDEELAAHEYGRAIELDPLDPTPFLYRAYYNLSTNRPVQALEDVEKSIELNNSRAVYRSKFLMDQDLAVRSAGLAEVFNSLGFSEAARVESIKSLNRDYTNFSAHRMLGDSYNTIFLNDASLSERKIARLLAPLSFNLFEGPNSEASLNEYNALFDMNEIRNQLGLEWDTFDDRLSPSAFQSGKIDNFGYLVGYDSDLTGGSKSGNYTYRHTARTALQFQPTYEDHFLLAADGIWRSKEDDRESISESEFEDYSVDLGYVHRFGPQSKLILDATYGDQHNRFLSEAVDRFVTINDIAGGILSTGELDALINQFSREKVSSFRGTAQYVFDSETAGLVLGTQFYTADQNRREMSPVLDDSAGLFSDLGYELKSHGFNDVSSADYYAYTTWHLTEWADLILGANFSELELEDREIAPFLQDTHNTSKLSPKFGLTLYPTDTTTVRTAYFESVRKSSFEDVESLEPTLVGGINQRFTDFPGAISRNTGVAVDQKISASTYFGAEYLHRDLIDPTVDGYSEVTADFDAIDLSSSGVAGESFEDHSDQDYVRTYLYQVFTPQLTGTLDYTWSDVEQFSFDAETETHRVSGGLRYFWSGGWFVLGQGAWREQSRIGSGFADDADINFFTADAGVGYRIPKRHGSILLLVNNIFDEDFVYDQSLGLEPFVAPETHLTLAATYNW